MAEAAAEQLLALQAEAPAGLAPEVLQAFLEGASWAEALDGFANLHAPTCPRRPGAFKRH